MKLMDIIVVVWLPVLLEAVIIIALVCDKVERLPEHLFQDMILELKPVP